MEESTEANNANIPLQHTERLYSSLRGTDRYFDFAPTGNGLFRPWKEITFAKQSLYGIERLYVSMRRLGIMVNCT